MVPSRFGKNFRNSPLQFNGDNSGKGMVYIKAGSFLMGADNEQASADEFPKHTVWWHPH